MQPSQNGKKVEVRARLANDVAAFLQAGGVITQHDHTDNKTYQDRMKKRRGSRGNGPNGGMGSSLKHRSNNPGALPDHSWRGGYKNAPKPKMPSIAVMGVGETV